MTDLISRQDAIDELRIEEELLKRALDDMDVIGQDREKYSWGLGLIESYISDIEELPSAEPVRHGVWIARTLSEITGYDPALSGDDPVCSYSCSVCGEDCYVSDTGDDILSNYCPNCGADMRGEKDG